MPKIVDHEERKARLAAAVWRVIERAGIEGATVRSVAAEAGVSPGSLRYYFSDQGELLLFAADLIARRVADRIAAHIAADDAGPGHAQLILEELLPLDTDRTVEAAVWLGFHSQGRFDGRLAPMRLAGWRGERHICRLALAGLNGLKPPRGPENVFPDTRDETAAARLHTFIDGLTLQAIAFPDQMPPKAARRILADFIADLRTDRRR